MLVLVIGLFLLTAVGAEPPDLIGAEPPDLVGAWDMTYHFLDDGEIAGQYTIPMTFLENGTGNWGAGDYPFLWTWISDNTFRYTEINSMSQITVSLIRNDEYLYLQKGYPDGGSIAVGILKKKSPDNE